MPFEMQADLTLVKVFAHLVFVVVVVAAVYFDGGKSEKENVA